MAWRIDQRGAPSTAGLLDLVRRYARRLDAWAGSRMAAAQRDYRATRLDAMEPEDAQRAADLVAQYVTALIVAPPSMGGPPPPPTAADVAKASRAAIDTAIRSARRGLLDAGMPPRLMGVRLGLEEDDPGNPLTRGRLIGVQVVRGPVEREIVAAWARDAASYIRAMPVDFGEEVAARMAGVIGDGWTWQRLRGELREVSTATESHLELIARDQIAKVNGYITESLHAAAGVTHYTWRATPDDATRQTHQDADGEVIAWASDGWPGAGFYGEAAHAGMGGQCRCTAEPVPPSDWGVDALPEFVDPRPARRAARDAAG